MSNDLSTLALDTATLVDLLRKRAKYQPGRHAYSFLRHGEIEDARLTYGEVDRQARAIAALLQSKGAFGKPVPLLHPPGLEYVAAFFGCLYAGAIAVPAYPPHSARMMPRIQAIIDDTHAQIVLTSMEALPELQRGFALLTTSGTIEILATDRIALQLADEWIEPPVTGDSLAFLQYTSGSTSTPKGVMVTHGNLIHNLKLLHRHCGQTPDSHMVSWLPPYHDMGLIGGILHPLYDGYPCTMMSPVSFLQRPFRWLQAISRYKATFAVGPNFAYELCCRKTTPEQRATLDLSSWYAAANGAEPIRAGTLKRFAETFAACGFREEAALPAYGLAEGTLLVASAHVSKPPHIQALQKEMLGQGRAVPAPLNGADDVNARYLVGYDHLPPEQKIIIVDPISLTRCPDDQIGEIWMAGGSVAKGYWNKPEETERVFHAYLADTHEGPFLRTGDLGSHNDGEIFIVGRLKDLIIIRGRNHYPQDIELTMERSHPAIRPGCCAAFSTECDGVEQLVVAAEVDAHYLPDRGHATQTIAEDRTPSSVYVNPEELIRAIRQSVSNEHDLFVSQVVLLKAGAIQKTSSGKIQRQACRVGFLQGTLNAWNE